MNAGIKSNNMTNKDSLFYFISAKSICIFLVSTLLSISHLSGQCGSGMVVTLATQDDVNNFIANHCTDFLGSITIRDDNDGTDDIIDLSPLSTLTSVGVNLMIAGNSALTNLEGLGSLTSVGENLVIRSNFALTSIDGLGSLTSVGDYLYLFNNGKLENIDGLSSLTSVGDYLSIWGNLKLDSLDDFCGLYTLLDVGGLLGSYKVSRNRFNPSEAEILSNGVCSTVSGTVD